MVSGFFCVGNRGMMDREVSGMDEDKRMDAEARYVGGAMSLPKLAEETGIPLKTLQKWSAADGWAKKRKKAQQRAMKKAVTRAVNRRARELATLIEASGVVERALLKAARQFEDAILEEKIDTRLVDGKNRAKNLLNVAEGIERMAHARGMMGAGMSQADAERLDLLKRKQALEEKKAAREEKQDADGVMIQMDKAVEELSE